MDRLAERFKTLVKKETEVSLDILLLLNQIKETGVYKQLGYSSLFAYLTEGLKYSEPAACRRISSARVIREYPEIKKLFIQRKVNLTTVSLFSKIITKENKRELLSKVVHKTKRQVEVILAEYRPQPQMLETVKPVFVQKKTFPKKLKAKQELSGIYRRQERLQEKPKIITEKRFELKFSVKEDTMSKFNEVKSLLSNKYPVGVSIEQVFNELLDNYLTKNSPKYKKTIKNKITTSKDSRYIPQSIKNKVFKRDKGRCTYTSPEGKKCNSNWDLEYDHIKPFALGGTNEESNLRLLCRCHNHMLAEKTFGSQIR